MPNDAAWMRCARAAVHLFRLEASQTLVAGFVFLLLDCGCCAVLPVYLYARAERILFDRVLKKPYICFILFHHTCTTFATGLVPYNLAMLFRFTLALVLALSRNAGVGAQITPAATLASLYSLTTSTSMPFPTATLSNSDTQSFIVSGWSLSKGRIQNGASELEFVQDPFPNASAPSSTGSTSGPVLQVTYPSGSFSHDTGGAQLYSLWNTSDGSQFNTMILSYEVAFDTNYDWVLGGKLPGVRGGPDPDGCSGGNASTGSNCFSSRLMWRKNGQGEGARATLLYILAPAHGRVQSTRIFLRRTRCALSPTSCVTTTALVLA